MITLATLYSCHQKEGTQVMQVGSFDSTAIATDTEMQQTMEGSYEYSKSVTVSPKLVYDVIAYGGPASRGEYAIIRRGADNKPDTVAHGRRKGIFKDAFTADLNNNCDPEIYIAEQSADKGKYGNIIGWEFDKEGKGAPLRFEHVFAKKTDVYRGGDSICPGKYTDGKDAVFVTFPAYRSTDVAGHPTAGTIKIIYMLADGELYPKAVNTPPAVSKNQWYLYFKTNK